MATKTAKKIKQEAAQFVPRSLDQVAEAIAEIGRRQRQRERIQAAMNDHFSSIKEKYEEEARPHNDEIRRLSEGVKLYCESHKEEILPSRSKTVSFTTGEISWRLRPPRVVVSSVEKVLKALEGLGLDRFIRTKKELNRDAILDEPQAIEHVKGIGVTQGEDFIIKPFETRLEELV